MPLHCWVSRLQIGLLLLFSTPSWIICFYYTVQRLQATQVSTSDQIASKKTPLSTPSTELQWHDRVVLGIEASV